MKNCDLIIKSKLRTLGAMGNFKKIRKLKIHVNIVNIDIKI